MKRFLFIFAATAALISCSTKQPEDVLIDKSAIEFLGNAFSDFSFTEDVNLFIAPNPEDNSKWSVQATTSVKKETSSTTDSVSIDIVPVDIRGVKLREDFCLQAQDMGNIIPVLNSSTENSKTLVFRSNRELSRKEAEQILAQTENLSVTVNSLKSQKTAIAEETAAKEEEIKKKEEQAKPTLNSLCEKYGVYGLLSKYDKLLSQRKKRDDKKVEDQLWEIEKKVMADGSLPQSLRQRFKDYIEDREDQIEDKY